MLYHRIDFIELFFLVIKTCGLRVVVIDWLLFSWDSILRTELFGAQWFTANIHHWVDIAFNFGWIESWQHIRTWSWITLHLNWGKYIKWFKSFLWLHVHILLHLRRRHILLHQVLWNNINYITPICLYWLLKWIRKSKLVLLLHLCWLWYDWRAFVC